MKTQIIIKGIVSIVTLILGSLLILGEAHQFEPLIWLTIKTVGFIALFVGVDLFPLKITLIMEYEEVMESLIGIFCAGVIAIGVAYYLILLG